MTKIIFMGTPNFSVAVLKNLLANDYDVIAAVTQPDRPVGRKKKLTQTPVKKEAIANNIPVYQPEKLSGSPELDELMNLDADLIITAAYGQFLPNKFLNSVKIAAINVHGSLLPKYRGGAPIQRAIMNGESQTGITIMYMAKKMDAGDMISQVAIPITEEDTAGSIFEKLSQVGSQELIRDLPSIIAGNNRQMKQNDDFVTFAPNIARSEEKIDINKPAVEINRQVRGLNPDPVAYLDLNNERTKIYQTTVSNETTDLKPGTVVDRTKKKLAVAAGNGSILYLDQIQPAGKSVMPIAAFLNGKGKDIKVGETIIK